MALLPILLHPDPRLRKVCAPVGRVTPEIEALATDMLATMYAAPGRGLAAPQVGLPWRMFVIDTGWKEGGPSPLVALLPEIVRRPGLNVSDGCPRFSTSPDSVRILCNQYSQGGGL